MCAKIEPKQPKTRIVCLHGSRAQLNTGFWIRDREIVEYVIIDGDRTTSARTCRGTTKNVSKGSSGRTSRKCGSYPSCCSTKTGGHATRLVDTRALGKPREFKSVREDWKDWSFKFKTFLCGANPDAGAAWDAAGIQDQPIVLASLPANEQKIS
eukprot:1269227-Amphidinium_carterae.1